LFGQWPLIGVSLILAPQYDSMTLFWRLAKRSENMPLTSNLAGRNLGLLLLGVWLILTGLLPLLDVRISSTVTMALAVLAIVAGILILLRR